MSENLSIDHFPSTELIDQSCQLAADLLTARRTAEEKREAQKMSRLLNDPAGKELTFRLADEVFRPVSAEKQATVFRRLIQAHGIPKFLRLHERFFMKIGAWVSRLFPALVMPAVTAQIRKDSSRVILSSEEPELSRYFKAHSKINVNLLGEAILGEQEARNRLEQNLALLAKPECQYLSVKISAIFSQINLFDEEGTLKEIQSRLRQLYRTGKFINLDMEEYRDLHLTCEAFKRTLNEPEFLNLEAGIVLQAYLPDSYDALKNLITWADTHPGGIKIRIVKGANLAMEKIEASHHHWQQAPYSDKVDVDANYKKMLHYAMAPKHIRLVRIGVASHNLFDIAYALLLREQNKVADRVELEMLEGMANHHARALEENNSPVLFYAPIVAKKDFHSAIAYLVRRLDENTSPDNFLAHVFSMEPGDASFLEQEARFRESCQRITTVSSSPRRTQNRQAFEPAAPTQGFQNSPETDWVLPKNLTWLKDEIKIYQADALCAAADLEDVDKALHLASHSDWPKTNASSRANLLRKCAVELEKARGRLIATMRLDAHKRPFESDIEISEAIDFSNYYADRTLDKSFSDGHEPHPLGPIVITPPWNFPCAIPCGGVLAALAMGNPVILKPAPETVQTAWEMVKCLWRAGIPDHALQFLPCPDHEIGQALVSSEKVAAVILTGSSQTANLFQSWNPDLKLFAETSGKNALVITASCDPDQAVKDLVQSAFGHAGQKCSAASIALIEGELYDHPGFMAQLLDAAQSLPVGPATDPASIITPLVQEPGSDLMRGLTQLDEGESWLLEPRKISDHLWSPGIRLGVKAGSWIHQTELFGPVLSIIRVRDLTEAIEIQNSSDFGLTGGICSLDPQEISQWKEEVEVGNAYINRPITGAIVRRQPFGGWKQSSFGPGAKAGGPNYLAQFCIWKESGLPEFQSEPNDVVKSLLGDDPREIAAARSYAYWWQKEFSQEHDPSSLLGETNHFRYRVAPEVIVENPDPLHIIAAATVGTKVVSASSHPLAKRLPKKTLINGRLELLNYLHEQSVSETTHRHGRI